MLNTRPVAIVSKDINKSFGHDQTKIDVIKNLSIALHAKELTLLMGPSGSGKSTLLAILSGLLKPDSGCVEIFGKNLWQLSEKEIEHFRLSHCGFIFQGFNLFSALTALQQVQLVLQYGDMPDAQAEEHATQYLINVGLQDRLHYRPHELSGGEKQRVAIARALAKHPKLIFADEPTSALDKHNGEMILDLLRHAAHEQDAAILCVTHDSRLLKYADRVLQIEDGLIIGDNHPDELEVLDENSH